MPTPVSCYGTDIVNQFRQLGVYTVPVAEIVAKGEAEIGMQQHGQHVDFPSVTGNET
jgi:hypothetical protein